jgi:hypothetical protein
MIASISIDIDDCAITFFFPDNVVDLIQKAKGLVTKNERKYIYYIICNIKLSIGRYES